MEEGPRKEGFFLMLMVIVNCKIVALPTTTTRQDNDRYSRLQLAAYSKKKKITLFVLKVQKFPSKNLKSFRGKWPPAHQLMRNYGGSSQSYQNTISLALYLCPFIVDSPLSTYYLLIHLSI